MKVIKIIKENSKNMSEDSIKDFLYKNFPAEIIRGLEYDDPKTIERAMKLLGIEYKSEESDFEQEENLEMEKMSC